MKGYEKAMYLVSFTYAVARMIIQQLFYMIMIAAILVSLIVIPHISPMLFSGLVLFLSLIMGYILDTKRNIHNRYFFSEEQTKEPILRISIFTAISVIIRSTVSALVALFVFSGRNQNLIAERSHLLVGMVLGVVIFGYFMEKLSKYDMVKVSYFYFPIILGVFFAVLGPDIPPVGWLDWIRTVLFGLPTEDLNQISDVIRQAAALLERTMATLLSPILNDWIANVLARIFSMNTLFGYVIALYVSILLYLGRAYRQALLVPDQFNHTT